MSTGRHPIEFAVIVASMLPLAMHFLLYPRSPNGRIVAAMSVVLLLLAVPISLSRTALVSLAAAMVVFALGWSWRRRVNGLLLFLLVLPIMSAVIPGVLEAMIGLFEGVDQDASIQARLSRLSAVMALVRERPWFGLGYGTWTADGNFLLDNEVWSLLLETGYVGTALTILLPIVAAVTAITSRSGGAATKETEHLGFAIAGGIAGLTISMVTFDALFYRILTSVLFLLIGAAGALWRLTRRDTMPSSAQERALGTPAPS
jgi:polysaccharide biosynthesis protein PslJ